MHFYPAIVAQNPLQPNHALCRSSHPHDSSHQGLFIHSSLFWTVPLSTTYSGHHIGMQKTASHVAAFINAENIIIADDDKFFLFTPKKKDLHNDFHKVVLPSNDSHFSHMGERGNAYKIQQGSSMIITDENTYKDYVVIFPGQWSFLP